MLLKGLLSPDGIAVHPQLGRVYVSEETRPSVRVVTGGQRCEAVSGETPIYSSDSFHPDRQSSIRSPEGIAFSPTGELYLVEDLPGGRLIRFNLDEAGVAKEGRQVALPGHWDSVAWESVDIGPNNEILLAGSTAEAARREDLTDLVFSGVLLYRDVNHQWWKILQRPFTSFSSASFSSDGERAVYVCEVTGEIGWISLTQKRLRYGTSTVQARSPESIDILPDGRLLIAEEQGVLMLLDPVQDVVTRVEVPSGTIETARWDDQAERILVSQDGSGSLLSIELSHSINRKEGVLGAVRMGPVETPRHIPVECPKFLADVLERGGLDFQNKNMSDRTFRAFAAKLPMVSFEARVGWTNLLSRCPVKTRLRIFDSSCSHPMP